MRCTRLPYYETVDVTMTRSGTILFWSRPEDTPRLPNSSAWTRVQVKCPSPPWEFEPDPRSLAHRMGPGEDGAAAFFKFLCNCKHRSIIKDVLGGGHPLWLGYITEMLADAEKLRFYDEGNVEPTSELFEDEVLNRLIGEGFNFKYRELLEMYGIVPDVEVCLKAWHDMTEEQ